MTVNKGSEQTIYLLVDSDMSCDPQHSYLSCLTRIYPAFANSVTPDQLEANWSWSALFTIQYLIYINNLDQVIWLSEN